MQRLDRKETHNIHLHQPLMLPQFQPTHLLPQFTMNQPQLMPLPQPLIAHQLQLMLQPQFIMSQHQLMLLLQHLM